MTHEKNLTTEEAVPQGNFRGMQAVHTVDHMGCQDLTHKHGTDQSQPSPEQKPITIYQRKMMTNHNKTESLLHWLCSYQRHKTDSKTIMPKMETFLLDLDKEEVQDST